MSEPVVEGQGEVVREGLRVRVTEMDTEAVAGALSPRVLLGVWVEDGHNVNVPEPECEVLWVLEVHTVALPVGRGGEGVPVPQADPENEGVSVPEALVVAQNVPVAS